VANASFKFVGHFADASGNLLRNFGSGLQFLVNAAELTGINFEGGYMPDPVSVNSVLASHGLIPSGATFVVDGWANLDHQHNNPVNILS
jgi:hypothetical protein